MIRHLICLWFAIVTSIGAVGAQDLTGLARVLPEESALRDIKRGGVQLDLSLSQGVPYRVFTLDEPRRLVVDFREVDWSALEPADFLESENVSAVRFGTYRPGWSRMVADLSVPLTVRTVELRQTDASGRARVTIQMARAEAETFALQSGAPYDARWDLPPAADVPTVAPRNDTNALRVMLDPGHGGIDPGAEQGGVDEKTMMLIFARELQDELLRAGGFDVFLTRTDDYFVSLEGRIAMAHTQSADVFISLHADSLGEGSAHGATIYTLSPEASDVASAKLAERHNRSDLLSGVDLSGADDRVTGVLLDLARQETQPRTEDLARTLVQTLTQTGGPMNRRPLRSAGFSVLKAADIPSVLIEIGFLSSPRDLENIKSAEWRQRMAGGIRAGLQAWRRDDLAQRPLVRR
ncbi:N-acetylmuramoyl-L-alanine amidase [Thalassococcus sp. S3]|uniref:N-acetylmuramoyl-L-alanine amidase n=1 Tax=Thalassococcus sp. S3 TaxID=2017482 RepID=UPI0010243016|nr:N-acetylmuramoyl-L-alanine amidase [Thalassococcus sp. S3]QBF31455.1 N-acetylmuramoyl-L-alanine amidase [Thalassococcus sp. S3]